MIKIICVGKIKEQYLRSAISEYEKRLKKFTKLEIIEVNDESNGNILEKEKNIIWILWLTNYRDIGNNVNWYIY